MGQLGSRTMIIALHGDFATPSMLERDMGDMSVSLEILFFDAGGWKKFEEQIERLLELIRSLGR